MVVLFLFLGLKVLKRGKQITNRYMGTYYVWMGVTMSLNVLYVALDVPVLIASLSNLVGASMVFAQVFLLLFVLIIRHSQAEINKQKQVLWITIAGLIGVGMFLVGMLGSGTIAGTNTDTGDTVPVWSIYYASFFFAGSVLFIGLTLYNAYVARKGFSDATMKKRFTYFLIGMILLFSLMVMNPWSNLEPAGTFRTIFGIYAIVIVPAAFLLYLSLGKEVAKKE